MESINVGDRVTLLKNVLELGKPAKAKIAGIVTRFTARGVEVRTQQDGYYTVPMADLTKVQS